MPVLKGTSIRLAAQRQAAVAFALAAAMLAASAAQAGDSCARSGGHGLWAFACTGAACTLRPTTVAVMDQDGTHDDAAFGFHVVIDPPSRISVQPPRGTAAD